MDEPSRLTGPITKLQHRVPVMKTSEKLELETRGYLLLKQWYNGVSTEEIACMVGSVLDIDKVTGNHKISTVQTLRPREASDAKPNTYSGLLRVGEFPLHTDCAHWDTPPHYLILRCLEGISSVVTLHAAIGFRMYCLPVGNKRLLQTHCMRARERIY